MILNLTYIFRCGLEIMVLKEILVLPTNHISILDTTKVYICSFYIHGEDKLLSPRINDCGL